MKVISTNTGKATTFLWNGKAEQTGIFKYPTDEPLFLSKTEVHKDTVIDRTHHAGINKACYLFATDHYPYWRNLYPELNWDWGMFGENLSVEGMDESKMCIGDTYKIGNVVVQVSQPREPCYKLGVRFGNAKILKEFIDYGHSGTYVRILEEGEVKNGDQLRLLEKSKNTLTIKECFQIILAKEKDPILLQKAINNPSLPEYKRDRLKKYL
ncbi:MULTISPECIES: MOSC domain-containing protein [unclassified Arenibacter]|jgi:MOSC domain-containing protein YiiM|uniref:MOSC domain-containing protein n=1 Tax=unclassified Arenibacter TaxID=2615047 RepID=UPI000E340D18|nr:MULTISPECIES: MOSC domain-containing protein [unclassified Arenibacter]MCM4165889.1 MOSC domain-containing protein [Arenibacter sp. A80]RFT54505.1 MOSC domain-containing protein [Arenibacter sp. P308M17]